MTFTFNFNVDNSDKENGDGETAVNNSLTKSEEATDKIEWKVSKEHFITDKHHQRAVRPENVESLRVGEDSLHYLDTESVSVGLSNSDYSGDLDAALTDNTDLVPGVYEVLYCLLLVQHNKSCLYQGGLKIWECSVDLVQYLHETRINTLQDKKVLELGCGAGLPGLLAHKYGASGKI